MNIICDVGTGEGTLAGWASPGGARAGGADPARGTQGPLAPTLLPMRDGLPAAELLSLLGPGAPPRLFSRLRLSALWRLPLPLPLLLLLRTSRLPLRGRLPLAVSSATGAVGVTGSAASVASSLLLKPALVGRWSGPLPSTAEVAVLTGAGRPRGKGPLPCRPPASQLKAPCRRRP